MSTNTCDFTNKSCQTVMVLSGTNSSTKDPKQGYEQELAVLKFSDGSTTLATGSTVAKLVLPENLPIVNALVSDPNTLFPVYAVGIGPDYSSTAPWPKPNTPVVVPDNAVSTMNQALQFRQNILASPSSKTAAAFQSALTSAQKEATSDAMITDMDNYFKSTESYKDVTFSAYSAVQSYLQAFARPWVQKNDASSDKDASGAVYYVYSAPEATKKGASSEGTIVATKKSTGSPDPSDHLSGYTISFVGDDDTDSSAKALSFDNGTFQDSEGGAISLSATYSYKGRFTGKSSETQMWPILVGTVLGKSVMAIPLSPESGWDKFWSSLSFSKVFNYFMEAMGLWMALDFLHTKFTKKKEGLDEDKKKNKGEEPNDQQVEQADSNANAAGDADVTENENLGQDIQGGGDFNVPSDNIPDAIDNVQNLSGDALNDIAVDNANGAIEMTGTTLESVAAIETTPAIEAAGNDLNEAGKSLQDGNVADATESISSANTNLNEAVEQLGDQISEEQKQAYENEIEANKETAEDAKETEEDSENAGEGDDPEGDFNPVESGLDV